MYLSVSGALIKQLIVMLQSILWDMKQLMKFCLCRGHLRTQYPDHNLASFCNQRYIGT